MGGSQGGEGCTTAAARASWETVEEYHREKARHGRFVPHLSISRACHFVSRLADLINSVCLSIVLGICEALGR